MRNRFRFITTAEAASIFNTVFSPRYSRSLIVQEEHSLLSAATFNYAVLRSFISRKWVLEFHGIDKPLVDVDCLLSTFTTQARKTNLGHSVEKHFRQRFREEIKSYAAVLDHPRKDNSRSVQLNRFIYEEHKRVNTFRYLTTNWNGYEAEALDGYSIYLAHIALNQLPSNVSYCKSFPVSNAGIQIDIVVDDVVYEISIPKAGGGISLYSHDTDIETFYEEIPPLMAAVRAL